MSLSKRMRGSDLALWDEVLVTIGGDRRGCGSSEGGAAVGAAGRAGGGDGRASARALPLSSRAHWDERGEPAGEEEPTPSSELGLAWVSTSDTDGAVGSSFSSEGLCARERVPVGGEEGGGEGGARAGKGAGT